MDVGEEVQVESGRTCPGELPTVVHEFKVQVADVLYLVIREYEGMLDCGEYGTVQYSKCTPKENWWL